MNDQTPNTPDHPDHEWESEMSDEFDRRVRDLHEAPLDLSSVKGKAMKIRNRRRAAVAGGIVAAAAAIVPVAVAATGNDTTTTIAPAGPSVTRTDTPTDTPTESPTDSPTEDVTSSSTPDETAVPDDGSLGFDYLETGTATGGDAVLHQSDGGVVELPRADYTAAADLGDLVAAYYQDEDGTGVVDLYDVGLGKITSSYDVRQPFVTTPTASAIGFITTGGEYLVVDRDGDETSFGTGFSESVYPAALIGDGDCATEAGCHPFFNDGNLEQAPFEINYEGPNTEVAGPDAIRLNDATDDFLASIQVSYSDTGSCGGVIDRSTGDFRFQTCKAQVLDISPRGDYVIGTDPYGDGLGPGYFTILDGTSGAEVARYSPERGFVADMAWLDDTHAVATVYGGAGWEIVSLGVDGSIETLVGPLDQGDEATPPFQLVPGP